MFLSLLVLIFLALYLQHTYLISGQPTSSVSPQWPQQMTFLLPQATGIPAAGPNYVGGFI